MADSTIGSLTAATYLNDASLLVVEQGGAALKLNGGTLKTYAAAAAQEQADASGASAAISDGAKVDSEAWAIGTKNGEPVISTDPQYQNNAKYFSDQTESTLAGKQDKLTVVPSGTGNVVSGVSISGGNLVVSKGKKIVTTNSVQGTVDTDCIITVRDENTISSSLTKLSDLFYNIWVEVDELSTEMYTVPSSYLLGVELGKKVSTEVGKGLSEVNLTTAMKTSYDTAVSKAHDTNCDMQLKSPDGTKIPIYTDNAGAVHIDGDIIQSGSSYETHAENINTPQNLIKLRDGATTGLASGEYAGLEAENYDGANTGRLVFGNDGIARVGDVGDEQPLATREESPTSGGVAVWNESTLKFDADVPVNQFVYGSTQYGGTISEDVNSIEKSGFYTCAGTAVGAPNVDYSWFITHTNSNVDSSSATQIAVAYSTTIIMMVRNKQAGVWGNWDGIYTKSQIDVIVPFGYPSLNDMILDTTKVPGRLYYAPKTTEEV